MSQTFLVAPSPPRNVSVRLVKPMTVEIRWRTPALPNGNISQYTVYAVPFTSGDDGAETLKTVIIYYSIPNNNSLYFHA